MKKIYFIIAVLCIASLFASCNHEQSPDVIGFGDEVEVEMNIITASQNQTRANDPTKDDYIENLTVLVFDVIGNPDDEDEIEAALKFSYYRHAWLNSGTNTYRAVLKAKENQRIYLAANANELIGKENLLLVDDSYEDVRNKLILTNPHELKYNELPMWGIVPGKITIKESDEFIQLGKINLLRSVASADLEITDASFGFTSAGIVRATDKGYLTHETGNVTEIGEDLKIDFPKVPSGTSYEFGNDFNIWKKTPTDGKIINQFYMFENDAPEDGKLYTKLIVEGKYKNGDNTYYPLAFRIKDKEKVQVARNRKFEITVSKVNGPGYPTVKEAIESEDVNMGYNVVVWDDGYRDSDIIVDGIYYVSFSGSKNILLANEAGSDVLRWFSTNALEWSGDAPTNLKWSFGVIDKDTPFATKDDLEDYVSISNSRFKVELIKDGTPGDSYYLKVTALADYKEDIAVAGERTAALSIRFGRIEFEITLEQVENGWKEGGNQDENL